MSRKKGPRFYRTTKDANHWTSEATALLQEYPDVVDSYHVKMDRDAGTKILAFGLRMPDGSVAPVQLSPDVEGIEKRLEEDGVTTRQGPAAVAWAQLYHLLELQLEAVASGAARAAEVFGGAVLTTGERTVGQALSEGRADVLEGETPLLGSG